MIKNPEQLTIGPSGELALPFGLLAEAGLSPGSLVLAYSNGDGRIVLRREADAAQDLIEFGSLD
ncbi:hypothetical protein LUW77_21855 [Streptomyces radiopugnans]|nr:hypothetical protein LUW77_21855 [Streptomyces radiopugnans]